MSENGNKRDGYVLPRDRTEAARLDEQHRHTIAAFGFLVHPSIDTSKPGLRFADLGCGSGSWIVDVARHFPQARCDGFDISGACFPTRPDVDEKFGARVQFHEQDTAAAGGFPAEFEGAFDVVALRYVHITMMGEQWDHAARNVASLLKPGGWVQWIDWDPLTVHIVQLRALAPCEAMTELRRGFVSIIRAHDTTQTSLIPDRLSVNGLANVRSELFAMDEKAAQRNFFNGTMLLSWCHIVKSAAEQGRPLAGWDEHRVEQLREKVKGEIDDGGAFIRLEVYCHTAQKPS